MHKSRRKLLSLGTSVVTALFLNAGIGSAFAASAPQVLLKTSMGEIVLELNPDKAPLSVENFLRYTKDGYYNGTVFHRIIPGFMIQGGGFDANLQQKPTGTPIVNEAKNGLHNQIYTVAMARTSAPNSATSQFFINVADNAALDYPGQDGVGYAVFGKVIKGMKVVDQIRQVKTTNRGIYGDVPVTPVVIDSATVVSPAK